MAEEQSTITIGGEQHESIEIGNNATLISMVNMASSKDRGRSRFKTKDDVILQH